MNRRLVLTGPESTGKSALTEWLAGELGLPYAPEYARYYLEKHGPAYDYELLLDLARGHLRFQRRHVPPEAPLGLLDTDLINYKIWCEVVYGNCHEEILAEMQAETGHCYLLCSPDIPWEQDPLRENPDDRPMLFDRHRREIEALGRPFEVVTGLGEARRQCALTAAGRLLSR